MPEPVLQAFFYYFGIVPARYTHPEWAAWVGLPLDDYLPFLTSMFLHGGWLHIIGNMWTLWIFGDNVEDRMGTTRFLIFYIICGLAAGLVHYFTNPNSTIPTCRSLRRDCRRARGLLSALSQFPCHHADSVVFPTAVCRGSGHNLFGVLAYQPHLQRCFVSRVTRGRRRRSILGSCRRLCRRRGAALVVCQRPA
jgi:hypothetical protein